MEMTTNLKVLCNNYGVDGDDVWSNNMLATDAARGPSGHIARSAPTAQPDAREIELVLALSKSIGEVVGMFAVGMGTEGPELWEPYCAAAAGELKSDSLDLDGIGVLFGDALYEESSISIQPLSNTAPWWDFVKGEAEFEPERLERWNAILEWFDTQDSFVERAFIAIDKQTQGMPGGCVFPRLCLGRTAAGSVAGLLGVVVYT